MSIIHEQGHFKCNQNGIKYGNVLHKHAGMIFKQTPITTGLKHRGLTLKEEGCSDIIKVVVQNST